MKYLVHLVSGGTVTFHVIDKIDHLTIKEEIEGEQDWIMHTIGTMVCMRYVAALEVVDEPPTAEMAAAFRAKYPHAGQEREGGVER